MNLVQANALIYLENTRMFDTMFFAGQKSGVINVGLDVLNISSTERDVIQSTQKALGCLDGEKTRTM